MRLSEDSIAKRVVVESGDPVAQSSLVVGDLGNVEGRFPCWEKVKRQEIVHRAFRALDSRTQECFVSCVHGKEEICARKCSSEPVESANG